MKEGNGMKNVGNHWANMLFSFCYWCLTLKSKLTGKYKSHYTIALLLLLQILDLLWKIAVSVLLTCVIQ